MLGLDNKSGADESDIRQNPRLNYLQRNGQLKVLSIVVSHPKEPKNNGREEFLDMAPRLPDRGPFPSTDKQFTVPVRNWKPERQPKKMSDRADNRPVEENVCKCLMHLTTLAIGG